MPNTRPSLPLWLLVAIMALSLFLSLVKWQDVPPCFNADEAAFGYNAYSLAKTGRDEYGTLLPLRLQSFGDNKLPLYSYIAAPFVGVLGLNEFTVVLPNIILMTILPGIVYALTYQLFKNTTMSLLAALGVSVNLALHHIARHAHEALLAATLITLATWLFLKKKYLLFFGVLMLALFTYHSSRIFALFFIGVLVLQWCKKQTRTTAFAVLLVTIAIGITVAVDSLYTPTRLQNLLLFTSKGFTLDKEELQREGGIRWLYTEPLLGIKELTFSHASYFSPQFLMIDGDKNTRFGYPGMAPLTPVEHIAIFIGIYFLFVKKAQHRWFLLSLFAISPFAASLSWADMSITRSLFMLIPAIILAAYGITSLLSTEKNPRLRLIFSCAVGSIALFFLVFVWDFYLFHYPKRAITVRAWQCGYRELADYIDKNYNRFDKFYITRKNGQPYIFLLFYRSVPPKTYQTQATLSEPDEYGFGQVERFDKFDFNFTVPQNPGRVALIGYPDDFQGVDWLDLSKIHIIKVGTEEMFWIYEGGGKTTTSSP